MPKAAPSCLRSLLPLIHGKKINNKTKLKELYLKHFSGVCRAPVEFANEIYTHLLTDDILDYTLINDIVTKQTMASTLTNEFFFACKNKPLDSSITGKVLEKLAQKRKIFISKDDFINFPIGRIGKDNPINSFVCTIIERIMVFELKTVMR